MRAITVRNGQQALPRVLQMLDEEGQHRNSRNGPVIQLPFPLSITYEQPCERVVFWPQRDCNPAFHLYESLWMLDGRNDVEPLARYAKQMLEYSDNGVTLHGAYGNRWRHWFGVDQVSRIINLLSTNPEDRRCVLQMWDTPSDLGYYGKDVPCNLTATFQIMFDKLNMVVFNRSNDIIWGMLGANLVHFSVLQEYMAGQIGVRVGTYTQVSANPHAYPKIYDPLKDLPRPSTYASVADPYHEGVQFVPMDAVTREEVRALLAGADAGFRPREDYPISMNPWIQLCGTVLLAHCMYKEFEKPDNYRRAMDILYPIIADTGGADWAVAMQQWIQRRYDKWQLTK